MRIMIIAMLVVSGCTRFDTADSDRSIIDLEVIPVELGGCIVRWSGNKQMLVKDDTVTIEGRVQ